jgi:hypothetical protein
LELKIREFIPKHRMVGEGLRNSEPRPAKFALELAGTLNRKVRRLGSCRPRRRCSINRIVPTYRAGRSRKILPKGRKKSPPVASNADSLYNRGTIARRSFAMPHSPPNRCRRFIAILSLAAFWAANLQAPAIVAAGASRHHDCSEHAAIDADACSPAPCSTAHGDQAPACPCCPGCSGCCHCSLTSIFCASPLMLPIDLAPSLSQSMVDAAALYTSPSHGRLTPPPKG